MDREDLRRNTEQPEKRTYKRPLMSQGLSLKEAQSRQVPFPVENYSKSVRLKIKQQIPVLPDENVIDTTTINRSFSLKMEPPKTIFRRPLELRGLRFIKNKQPFPESSEENDANNTKSLQMEQNDSKSEEESRLHKSLRLRTRHPGRLNPIQKQLESESESNLRSTNQSIAIEEYKLMPENEQRINPRQQLNEAEREDKYNSHSQNKNEHSNHNEMERTPKAKYII